MGRVSKWQNTNKFYHWEGSQGLKNLCRFVQDELGYSDPMHFGQFEGGSYGSLIHFLEDNPGAIEAMLDWVEDWYPDEEEDDFEEPDETDSEDVF